MKRPGMDPKKVKATDHGSVFESIHSLMHLFRTRQYAVLKNHPYKLTHMEGKLLGFFSKHPGASLRDLTEHTGRDKSQLARLIAGLKKQGLLEGQDNDHDRRSVKLRLTPEGKSIHLILHREVDKLSATAVEALTINERRQLISLLTRIQSQLEHVGEPSLERT